MNLIEIKQSVQNRKQMEFDDFLKIKCIVLPSSTYYEKLEKNWLSNEFKTLELYQHGINAAKIECFSRNIQNSELPDGTNAVGESPDGRRLQYIGQMYVTCQSELAGASHARKRHRDPGRGTIQNNHQIMK